MNTKTQITLDQIYAPIQESMTQIESTIVDILATSNDLTREVIRYFFSNRGKLLRPALCLLGAQFGKSDLKTVLRVASSLEVFHSATLIHDDIIDSSFVRRNAPTINAKWTPQVAVLVGDYLYDKSFSEIFGTHKQDLISLFLSTATTVCDGEILELREKDNFSLKEDQYLEIIEKKTASLLSTCIESGGMLASLPMEQIVALKNYGLYLGMAFQIVDDCLDFTGSQEDFGKTIGLDASEGVLTLPVIRLLSLVSENQKSEVFKIFKSNLGPEKLSYLQNLISEYGTVNYALQKAKDYTDRARLELSTLAECPAKKSLQTLLDFVIQRSR